MPTPSVTSPAFIQLSQSAGPVSGSISGNTGCAEAIGAEHEVEYGYVSSLHLFVPPDVVIHTWLMLSQSALSSQTSLHPGSGVGVGV